MDTPAASSERHGNTLFGTTPARVAGIQGLDPRTRSKWAVKVWFVRSSVQGQQDPEYLYRTGRQTWFDNRPETLRMAFCVNLLPHMRIAHVLYSFFLCSYTCSSYEVDNLRSIISIIPMDTFCGFCGKSVESSA